MNDVPRVAWVLGSATLCAVPFWVATVRVSRRHLELLRSRYAATVQAEFPEHTWKDKGTRQTVRDLAAAEARFVELAAGDPELSRMTVVRRRLVIVASAFSALPFLYLLMYLDSLVSG